MFHSYKDALNKIPNQIIYLIMLIGVAFAGLAFKNFQSLLLIEHFKFTIQQMTMLISAFGVGSLIGTWLAGMLLKRIASNLVIFISLLFSAVAPFILLFSHHDYQVIFGFMTFAITSSGVRPAFQLQLANIEDAKIAKQAYSLYRVCINTGTALGAFIGGLIADIHYNYLLIFSATCMLFISLSFLYVRQKEKVEITENQPISSEKRHPFKNQHMRRLLITTLLFSFSMFQIYSFLPIYLVERLGISKFEFGSLSVLNFTIILTLELYITNKLSNLGNHVTGAFGAILLSICYFMASFKIDNLIYIYVYYSLFSLSICFFFASIMSEIAIISKEFTNKSEYMVWYQIMIDLIIIIGPIISGIIVIYFDIQGLWYFCSATALLAAINLLANRLHIKRNELK